MSRLARYRKAVVATLGVAATIAVTIPPDSSMWRTAQIILALATIAGVRQVRNAPPSRQVERDQLADELDHAPSRVAAQRPPRAYRSRAEADKLPPPTTGVKPPDPPS